MLKKFMDSYKALIAIPVILTIIAVGVIAFNGIEEGIELKGGSIAVLEMNQPTSSNSLENQLKDSFYKQGLSVSEVDVVSNSGNDITLQMEDELNSTVFDNALENKGKVVSYNAIGPVLSDEAMVQIYWAMAFAFIFMSITVFIIFREPIPSLGVIIAAGSDIIIAIAGMSIFNIPLSIASVGALLMLIGYSVDTDILLTTRILRRKEGTIVKRAKEAMKTGMTMSIGAILSMVVLYIVTIVMIPEASTLSDIAAVLIIGLVADILTTWVMNLGVLRWYMEWGK